MPPLPKAGAQLELDTSQWDAAYKGVLADAGKIDAAISDLSGTVDLKVSVSDSELKTAADLAADLDTSTSMTVNVNDTELSDAADQIETLTALTAIDLAINISGTALSFFESLGRFSGVGGILELDSALATIEARTGRMIPNAETLISDLYTNGWGESRTEIAGVLSLAGQLQIAQDELGSATETAFQVAAVTGQDVNDVLNTMDTMVKAGITPSYQAAGDVIVTGFQNGLNKSDDLLDSLGEYATKLGTMRISAGGALAILNSGLEQGVINTDFISDSVREFGIRLGDISTDENVAAAFEKLDELSDIDLAASLDAYQAGTISGDEFMQGIFDSIGQANTADPATANTVVEALFGTQAEDLGAEVWGNLSTDADAAFGDIEGRAETAGNTISDTLGVTVDTFLRNIEQMATDFLSSDAIDLDGKIETFKTQLQTAMATAMNGGTLGETLEVGFGITGVDTALANVSRVFGQFVITLLEIVATIQDPLGINDADKGTRGEITRLATAQLPFDLQVANPDEFDAIFTQAAQRGVSLADMGTALTTALDASVADGDFDRTKEILANIMADAEADPTAVQTLVDKYNTAIDEAMAASKPPAETDGWWTRLKPPAELDGAKAFTGPSGTGAKGGNWWDTIEVSPETIASLNDASTAVTTLDTDVDTALTNAQLVTGLATQSMVDAFSAMTDGVTTADEEIAMAITGNTMTASFDAMSASADQNVEATKASFQGLLATVSSVDVRMSAFFNSIMAKVGSVNSAIEGIGTVPSGGGGGTTNNTTVNVNQVNNVQGNAQAAQAGYALGATIRGMA